MKEELLKAKRYADLVSPETAGMAQANFEMMTKRSISYPAGLDEDQRKGLEKRSRNYAIKTAAENLEMLAGGGQLMEATELAEKVLYYDSSDETVDLIRHHLERAGHVDLLDELLTQETGF